LQVFLSVLGISLGVAVVVSMELANESAKKSFSLSTDAITGSSTHFIDGGTSGLHESFYRTLKIDLKIRHASPIIELLGTTNLSDTPDRWNIPITILGIDPLSEESFQTSWRNISNSDIRRLISYPLTIFTTHSTAERLGISNGDLINIKINGIHHTMELTGLIEPENPVSEQALNNILFTDISTAQEITGKYQTITRIDLIVDSNELTAIRKALPPGAYVEESSSRNSTTEQMTRAFDINLTALSLLSLLVGSFIIYNTMTFSVVRRRRQIGMLRAIGVSKSQIFTLILVEALTIGLVGSIIGIIGGIFLGNFLLGIVSQTINDLYFAVSVNDLHINPLSLVQAGLLGIIATLLASAIPAIEATSVPPATSLAHSSLESLISKYIPHISTCGLVLLLASCLILLTPSNNLIMSFIGLFCLVIGSALIIPIATIFSLKLLTPMTRIIFGLMGAVATRSILNSLSRTSVAIATLTVAISLAIGISIMIQSFRETVDLWLDTALGDGIYISTPSANLNLLESSIKTSILDKLYSFDEITHIDTFRRARVRSPNGPVQVVSIDTTFKTFNRPNRFKSGDPENIWNTFKIGKSVVISEPFAFRNNIRTGDSLILNTKTGQQSFVVSGIYYDYSSSDGLVMIHHSIYKTLWEDTAISSARLNLANTADIQDTINKIHSSTSNIQTLAIRSDIELKHAALEVFDRSFTITSVMRTITIVIAFVGVLGALLSLQIELRKEFGIMRALGFAPSQISKLITLQTAVIGLLSGLFAIPIGIGLASGLIHVVNRRSFGWSMDMHIYPTIFIEAVSIALIAALAASVYPSIRILRSSQSLYLQEE
jgi:putative ABC transport system permease protein